MTQMEHEPSKTPDTLHIGSEIKRVLNQQRRSAIWLSRKLYCDRTNIYKLFGRSSVDTDMLLRISLILQYDFFEQYSRLYAEKSCRQNIDTL